MVVQGVLQPLLRLPESLGVAEFAFHPIVFESGQLQARSTKVYHTCSIAASTDVVLLPPAMVLSMIKNHLGSMQKMLLVCKWRAPGSLDGFIKMLYKPCQQGYRGRTSITCQVMHDKLLLRFELLLRFGIQQQAKQEEHDDVVNHQVCYHTFASVVFST
jgi:hypothetical protein